MRTVVACLAVVLLTASAALATYVVNESALIDTALLQVGQRLTLTLTENPSTGFTWEYSFPRGAFRVRNDSYQPPPAGSPVGAPGTRLITLTALARGDFYLSIREVQPWPGGDQGPWLYLMLRVMDGDEDPLPPPPIFADETAFNPALFLDQGERLIIVLPENATTSYRWRCTWEPINALLLALDAYYPPRGGVIGAPGVHRFGFLLSRPGLARIVLQEGNFRPGGPRLLPQSLLVNILRRDG